MEKGVQTFIYGACLVAILLIVSFVFRRSDNYVLSWLVLFGAIIAGILFVYVLNNTKIKSARLAAKAFLIIPVLIGITFIFSIGIYSIYNSSSNSFKSFLDFSPWIFVWGLILLVDISEVILFVYMDNTRSRFLKFVTLIIGISVYFVAGVVGALFITPPSFGTYGTPLYRPKVK